jgi:hypothetical protein
MWYKISDGCPKWLFTIIIICSRYKGLKNHGLLSLRGNEMTETILQVIEKMKNAASLRSLQ